MYFVIFILLGAFFILNLFIGVIIDNFNRLKQQYEDGADGAGLFLTPGQRNWINTLKAASLKKPSRRLTRPTVCYKLNIITKKYHTYVHLTGNYLKRSSVATSANHCISYKTHFEISINSIIAQQNQPFPTFLRFLLKALEPVSELF